MPNAPDLVDESTIGSIPETPGQPGKPGQVVEVRAAADRQYTSSSQLSWWSNYPRSLSWALDDIAVSFGADIYERMLLDSQVRAMTNVLIGSILEDGIKLAPAIEDKEEDGYEQAKTVHDDAEHMLDDLHTSLDTVLWDMLDAVALGNKMAEQVYDYDRSYSGKQQYLLSDLAVVPREATAFVVDAYMNIVGILARIPGQPLNVQQGMLLDNPARIGNLLPRSKFAILTFRPKNRDPRGTSVLRPAFDGWNRKQQLKKEQLKFLAQFASPSLVGYTAEGAEPYPVIGPDGAPVLDVYGNAVLRSPEQDMTDALQAFANGTATAFPYGAKVQPIEMAGDGKAFIDAMTQIDREIAKAILNQILATEEGLHQTRASTSGHKDILDTLVRQAKRPVERMMERDVLRVWILLNYGADMLQFAPNITLGVAEQEDLPRLWAATAALTNSGYLDVSQYPEMDRQIGVPEREEPPKQEIPIRETISAQGGTVTVPGQVQAPPQPGAQATAGQDTTQQPAAFAKKGKPDHEGEEMMRKAFDDLMQEVFEGKRGKA